MSEFIRFLWPLLLLTLLSVPLLAWLYVRMWRRRRAATVDLGPFGVLQNAQGAAMGRRRHVPPALYLAGLAMLCLAAARPEMMVSLPRIEGTVVLAFDTSNSMTADDLAPTRMDAAKEAAQLFVENQPSTVRVGVVAFAGETMEFPMTVDYSAIGLFLRDLGPYDMPVGGTAKWRSA